MFFQVDKNSPVALSFPPRPIVNPNHSDIVTVGWACRCEFDRPKERVSAALKAEMLSQPKTSFAVQGVGDETHRFVQANRLSAVAPNYIREAFREYFTAAIVAKAEESA
jgi:hypothetical protein